VWTACAVPAAPMPPSLELPKPPTDLRATRVADKVTLTWTAPTQTTDKAGLKLVGPTRVCRAFAPMTACETVVTEIPAGQKPEFTDTLTTDMEAQHATGIAVYALEVQNSRGKSAGLSNQIKVPLAPTLPPPSDLRVNVTPDGPVISFAASPERANPDIHHTFRILRREQGSDKDVQIAVEDFTVPADQEYQLRNKMRTIVNVPDRTFEWEKTYIYRVQPVTTVTLEGQQLEIAGEDSQPVSIFVHDVFPPAAPTGVQAVFTSAHGANFIDLTWAPNLDPDLDGYNVYRREEGRAPVKLNSDIVKAPAFRDSNITAGHRYNYSVTAVDLRNNESPRSAEASEQVPQP
jgi:hypothetical protein